MSLMVSQVFQRSQTGMNMRALTVAASDEAKQLKISLSYS